MKNKKSIGLVLTIVGGLFLVFGLSYAFYNYVITGDQNTVLVTGDIYMNYTENNQIDLNNAVPMDKESALKLNDNIFNFTISGKNQSSKDIYYGISMVYGEEQTSKTRLKDEDIDVYLTSGEDVLVNANRYKALNDTRIWVEKINANTDTYTKDYSLRLWIDESVTIGNQNVDYTTDVWNNSYASFKVKVDGNLNEMNVPLEVDYQNSYYENGNTYFMVSISNYLNPSEKGIALASADTMKLDITTTNKDVVFTYQDDAGNKSEDGQNLSSISQTYTFEENKKVKMQVFVNSKNDIDLKTDINIKLTKNDTENYEILKYMHIKGAKDYCKNNGFSNFAECLLVSEQLSNNVEEAKEEITKKGNVDTSKTSPVMTYVATEEKPGATVLQEAGWLFAYADGVTFDTKTGNFILTGNLKQNQSLTSAMNGKWTCGTNDIGTTCSTVYHITSMDGNTIKTASSRTYQIANTIGSEVGLYQTTDNDGDTYFYRGDVKNNNVKFAGFYWKIIRINGDGSIRLIYNGNHANATKMEASSVTGKGEAYNNQAYDPTYVGYMYGENFSKTPVKSKDAEYTNIQVNTKYTFGKGYTGDETSRTFKLTNADYTGTFTEWNTANKLSEGYKYICTQFVSGNCRFLMEVIKVNSATSIQVYYYTYGSMSYDGTRLDTASSSVKTILENWYTENIETSNELNKNATDYISLDATFCNDRTLSTQVGNGDGFSMSPQTRYAGWDRIVTRKKPSLVCQNIVDLFSAKGGSGKGNKKLDKPIGLITADEASFAGGLHNIPNENYYLYSASGFLAMTPPNSSSPFANARFGCVGDRGEISGSGVADSTKGARAVINLKSDVLLAGGNGTMDDPYTVKLAS